MIQDKIIVLFFFQFNGTMSGAPMYLHNFLKKIDRSKFEPILVTQIESELSRVWESHQAECIILPLPKSLQAKNEEGLNLSKSKFAQAVIDVFRYNVKVSQLAKARKVDIIWGRNVKSMLFLMFASSWTKVPLIWDIGLEKEGKGILAKLYKMAIRRVAIAVSQSKSTYLQILDKEDQSKYKSKLKVIFPGTNQERIDEIESFRGSYQKMDSGNFKLISVGAFSKRKNQLMQLKVLKSLLDSGEKVELKMVGPSSDEIYMEGLNSYIKEHNLQNNVSIHLWSDNVVELLFESDIYLLTSTNEGVPRVLHEAARAGLPIVTTNAGGASEAVNHDVTGYVVDVNDTIDMSNSIRLLLGDKQRRLNFGKEASKMASLKFSPDTWYKEYESYLIQLANA